MANSSSMQVYVKVVNFGVSPLVIVDCLIFEAIFLSDDDEKHVLSVSTCPSSEVPPRRPTLVSPEMFQLIVKAASECSCFLPSYGHILVFGRHMVVMAAPPLAASTRREEASASVRVFPSMLSVARGGCVLQSAPCWWS